MRYTNFTPQDENAFLTLLRRGAAAFLYSPSVCAGGQRYIYDETDRDVRTIAISGTIFVPLCFFSEYLHTACVTDSDGAVLRVNGYTLTLKGEDISYFRNGALGTFTLAPRRRKGHLYVPALETGRLLGFCANTYYEGRYVVLADEETIQTLDAHESLQHAGAYALFGEFDISCATLADYKQARTRWKERLVGSKTLNDMGSPVVRSKIQAISAACKRAWTSLNRDKEPIILWGTNAPTESNEVYDQYCQISCLAKGYATYGSDYYRNPELLRDILSAMDWMCEHMFGEAEIAGTGWRDVHLFNWWYWYVGAPEEITDILFMLEDEIPLAERKRYLKCFEWLATWMCYGENSALSRISICTKVGLALEEAKYIEKENQDFDYLLHLRETGGGARVDYADFTHMFPYNLAYGMLHLDRVLLVASMLSGTALAFTNPQQYNQYGFARYMFEPALYQGQGMMMFLGRSTFGSALQTGAVTIVNLLPMIGLFGEEEDAYLRKMIRRNVQNERVREIVRASCSLDMLARFESILADTCISGDNDYEYAHAWYTADRAAQHRSNYAVGIALSSSREFTYESINSANKTGWYTGDGAFYLYTTYDDASFDGKNFLLNNIHVAYRYPGTTEDERPRVIRSIRSANPYKPDNDFAGSLQFQDKYLTAAMDFRSMHYEGPDDHPDDSGYGGGIAPHANDLRSKKAWFCLDDEIVCLSAGITSTMDSQVNTTLEHRRIVKDEQYSQYVQTADACVKLEKTDGRQVFDDPQWILMEGHTGYLFLESGQVYVNRYTHKPRNVSNTGFKPGVAEAGVPVQPFLEIGISHGVNPQNTSYAYAVLPYATEEKLRSYYAAPDVEILANTDALQAVYERNLGIASMVFYKAGTCRAGSYTVTSSAPAIVMLGEREGCVEFGACDATHLAAEIVYTISGEHRILEKDTRINVRYEEGNTVLCVQHQNVHGRPMRLICEA